MVTGLLLPCNKKSCCVYKHEGGSSTRILTLLKAGYLSRGHLELFRKPSKRRTGPYPHNNNNHERKRFRELKVAIWNIRGFVQKTEELQTEPHTRKLTEPSSQKQRRKTKDQRI
jgi:hypothetical protein